VLFSWENVPHKNQFGTLVVEAEHEEEAKFIGWCILNEQIRLKKLIMPITPEDFIARTPSVSGSAGVLLLSPE